MNHFSLYQISPTTYITEVDGKRVSARHVKVDVGLNSMPIAEIELNSQSNLELDARVIFDDDTVLKNVAYKLDNIEFLVKLLDLIERHNKSQDV